MPPPKKATRLCPVCESSLLYYQKRFCSKACYGKFTRGEHYVERARPSDIKFKPVHRVTDRMQEKINIGIDNLDNLKFEQRILKPGHPDFESVCKECTYIGNIKRTLRVIGVLDGIDGIQ